jgi:outer membrane protein OmpA-like peptidoglycan-associated protein
MPTALLFDATFDGAQMVLRGGAPNAAAVTVLTKAAGVPAKSLKVTQGLPDTFVASANSGLAAMAQLDSGHLGFDGTTWWLRGAAATQAQHDSVAGMIAALPNGSDWSVAIDDAASPLAACQERVATLAKRNVIQFTTGKATLTKDSLPALDALAADLKICPDTNVHVQGHTDNDGAAATNVALSVARAEAVVAALVQRGIVEDRLIAEGYGSSVPVAPNTTKAGKAANRRIAFEIDPP